MTTQDTAQGAEPMEIDDDMLDGVTGGMGPVIGRGPRGPAAPKPTGNPGDDGGKDAGGNPKPEPTPGDGPIAKGPALPDDPTTPSMPIGKGLF